MKPILNDMANAYSGRAIVVTADMDSNRHLVRAFRIRMMPTQVFVMPDGKEFYRHEGFLQTHDIAEVFGKMGLPKIEARSVASQATVPENSLPAPAGKGSR